MVSLKIKCWLPDQEVVVEYPPTIDLSTPSLGITFTKMLMSLL